MNREEKEQQVIQDFKETFATDHGERVLERIAKFCGKELTEHYQNTPVGSLEKDPTGYAEYNMCKTPEVEKDLEIYRVEYGYS